MTMQRWVQLTYWPLIVASVIFIFFYSWQVIADLQGPLENLARGFMAVTWVVFAVDYFVRLSLARPKWKWVKSHLFDLAIVVLPALRPLRLLKALTVVKSLHVTAGAALRSNIALYAAGAAAILIWIAALAVLDAERGAPGANIENFGDAVWWAFVTITTVGYGDFFPVTPGGRLVAVFLMCGGVAVVGVVTATLASWVIESAAARGNDEEEPATRGQVRALARDFESFMIGRGPADRPGDDPPPAPSGPAT